MAQDQAVDSEHSEPYTYSPLDEEAQEIRLLTLLPGSFSSDVRVCLDITPFTKSHVPNFEAVSYTWGSAENPVSIFIGNSGRTTLAVTQNLGKALPYFRSEDKSRVLWVDAICVDQKNLKERGQQVKRMADIFSKAVRVLVWLGPASENSELALDLFERIASKVKVDEATFNIVATTNEAHWVDSEAGVPFNEVEFLSIWQFIQRPWFGRLWIWQEVHLALGDVEVMCGVRTIPWTALQLAIRWLGRKPLAILDLDEEHYKRFINVINLCLGVNHYRTIRRVIHYSKNSNCSDPRDKIYALLSLIYRPWSIRIEPNYTKGVYQTYRDFALSLIESSHDLDILNIVESHEHLEGVPSWVPNLISPLPYNHLELSNASTSSRHSLSIKHVVNILEVEGVIVAGIRQVEPMVFFQNVSGGKKDVRGLRDFATSIGFRKVSFQSRQHKAFTRTICGNCFGDRISPVQSSVLSAAEGEAVAYKILTFDMDEDLGAVWESSRRELDFIRHVCIGRSFYLTEDGICGLAPLLANQGDIVTVLLGCQSPIVLRPTIDGRYKVIGEAYCDGFMDGEALFGTFPDSFEAILIYDASGGSYGWAYFNKVTGNFQVEDPRRGPLPPGWQIWRHPGEDFDQIFKNDETGEETWQDPRLTSGELRKRGVPLQVFNLV